MKRYFIDVENVHNRWGYFLNKADKNTQFILFYSDKCPALPLVMLEKLLKSGAQFELIHCMTDTSGRSALDFQLVTELGHRIAALSAQTDIKSQEFIILSIDTDYDVVISYWAQRGVSIKRDQPMLTQAPASRPFTPSKPIMPASTITPVAKPVETATDVMVDATPARVDLEPSLPKDSEGRYKMCLAIYDKILTEAPIPKEQRRIIARIIADGSSLPENRRKINIYNQMLKEFGRANGQTIYKKIEAALIKILAECPPAILTGNA